jgi:transposase
MSIGKIPKTSYIQGVFRHFFVLVFIAIEPEIWYTFHMKTTNENILTEQQLNACSREQLLSICKILMDQNKEISNKLEYLTQQINLANHRRFCSSSEKDKYPEGYEQTAFCFNEAEAVSNACATEPEYEEVVPKPYRRKKQKGKRETDLAEFPVVHIEHKLSDEEKFCSECGKILKILTTETTSYLRFVPAHFEREEHEVYVYSCEDSKCGNIVRAQKDPSLLRGSIATPSIVAAIMNGKYVNSVPLARHESEFERYGVHLSRQTMANWMIRCSEEYLSLIYDEMKKHLLLHKVIQADETRVQVLHEENRKATTDSWMWVYRSGELCDGPPIILFNYETTRGGYHPKEFLKEYSGYLTADGYQAYHNLPESIVVSGCLCHARRKYDEILKSIPEKDRKGTVADEAIKRIGLLYRIESLIKDKSADERREIRLKQSKPILDAYFQWLDSMSQAINNGSMIGKAINYSLNQREYLEHYLLDGSIAIDNSATERSIRIFATGRKNWEFCNTPNGARASAIIYSITQTAIANGLRPYEYLVHILENIPKHYMGTSRDFLKDLLPWSEKIPENCKSKKNKI